MTLPTSRLTSSIRALASASVMPTTGGTAYRSGPLETTSATSVPRRTSVPGAGSRRDDDRPWAPSRRTPRSPVGSRDAVRTAATASAWVRPCTDGHGGRGAGPEQEEPRRERGDEGGCDDRRPPAAASAGRRPSPATTTGPRGAAGERSMRGRVLGARPGGQATAGARRPRRPTAAAALHGEGGGRRGQGGGGRGGGSPAGSGVERGRWTGWPGCDGRASRKSAASVGRSSGSRAVATATRSSSAGGRPGDPARRARAPRRGRAGRRRGSGCRR